MLRLDCARTATLLQRRIAHVRAETPQTPNRFDLVFDQQRRLFALV
jgi:hypothetical protein